LAGRSDRQQDCPTDTNGDDQLEGAAARPGSCRPVYRLRQGFDKGQRAGARPLASSPRCWRASGPRAVSWLTGRFMGSSVSVAAAGMHCDPEPASNRSVSENATYCRRAS